MSSSETRIAARVCGFLCMLMASAMLGVAAYGQWADERGVIGFALSAVLVGGIGVSFVLGHGRELGAFTPRTGFILVAAAWLVASLVGAVPLMVVLRLPFVDALFESVSGITTTGSTVLVGLDQMPKTVLLWRSLLQWIGGLGIVAMGLVLLPFLRVGGVAIFRLESSDVSELAQTGRFVRFSIAMAYVYLAMTAIYGIAYFLLGMSLFDAVNHAMTTVATGGYSTHDASFGAFADNIPLVWAGTLFMAASALPFSLYIMMLISPRRDWRWESQATVFIALFAGTTLLAIIYRAAQAGRLDLETATAAAFNVASVLSTTGYATEDYQLWGPGAALLFLLITPLGGCAGSTSGGLKAYRMIIIWQMIVAHVERLIYPHAVSQGGFGYGPRGARLRASAVVFVFMYVTAVVVFAIGLASFGLDPVSSLSGAMTALANVGPGLGAIIGPVGNFEPLPDGAKALLVLAMLLGRLELVAVLVLISPVFWRR